MTAVVQDWRCKQMSACMHLHPPTSITDRNGSVLVHACINQHSEQHENMYNMRMFGCNNKQVRLQRGANNRACIKPFNSQVHNVLLLAFLQHSSTPAISRLLLLSARCRTRMPLLQSACCRTIYPLLLGASCRTLYPQKLPLQDLNPAPYPCCHPTARQGNCCLDNCSDLLP